MALYLAILGAAGLLCSGMTRRTGAALCRDGVLRWAGMSNAAIRGIYLSLLGAGIGIAAHYLIAALVGLNSGTASAFALTLPTQLISLLLCPYIIMGALFTGK